MSNRPCELCGYQRPESRSPIVHTWEGCAHRLAQQKAKLESENATLRQQLDSFPLCECSHAWAGHCGHTVAVGQPAPHHCAHCDCHWYKPFFMRLQVWTPDSGKEG